MALLPEGGCSGFLEGQGERQGSWARGKKGCWNWVPPPQPGQLQVTPGTGEAQAPCFSFPGAVRAGVGAGAHGQPPSGWEARSPCFQALTSSHLLSSDPSISYHRSPNFTFSPPNLLGTHGLRAFAMLFLLPAVFFPYEVLTQLKRPWCWERMKAVGEGKWTC